MRTALIESHSVRNASRRPLKCIKVKQQIRLGVAEQTAKRLESRQLNRMQSDFVSADWLDKCGLVTMERCQQSKGQPHLLLVSFFYWPVLPLCAFIDGQSGQQPIFMFVSGANRRRHALGSGRTMASSSTAQKKNKAKKERERERSFLWPPSVRQAETGAKRNNGTMVSSTRI